jgi:hypothetical protein
VTAAPYQFGYCAPPVQESSFGHGTAGSSFTSYNTGTLAAGDMGYLILQVPGAATIAVTDTAGNTWSQAAAFSGSSMYTYIFTTSGSTVSTTPSNIGVTSNVTQWLSATLYGVPGAEYADLSYSASGTGTSAALTVASSAVPVQDTRAIIAFLSSNTLHISGSPSGCTTFGVNNQNSAASPPLCSNMAYKDGLGSGMTVGSTYSASTNWSVLAIACRSTKPGGQGGFFAFM